MKIGTTMFSVKFKDKMPCENETVIASDLAYYLYYLDIIPKELSDWKLDDIIEHKKRDEEEFNEISKGYSNLFQEYALIRLKANELYERNRVIALTMGLLRQKLMQLKEDGADIGLNLSDSSILIVST